MSEDKETKSSFDFETFDKAAKFISATLDIWNQQDLHGFQPLGAIGYPSQVPVLVRFEHNPKAYRLKFMRDILLTKAVEELTESRNIEIDINDKDAWNELQQDTQLVSKANDLCYDPSFVERHINYAEHQADLYMQVVSDSLILDCLSIGVELSIKIAHEVILESHRLHNGFERRSAELLKASLTQTVRNFSKELFKSPRGIPKGKKKKPIGLKKLETEFSVKTETGFYELLYEEIKKRESNDHAATKTYITMILQLKNTKQLDSILEYYKDNRDWSEIKKAAEKRNSL